MSLQKYKALLKTIELGSISAAAEQMGYTQPAVSRMIADLEREWDIELLRRSRGGLEISSACQDILPLIKAVVADCAELDFAIGAFHRVHKGLVRVGTFTSVADQWMPALLKSFQETYPQIEFDLINLENYVEIEDWIRHGKLDCGFVSMPTATDLQTEFLMRDELVAVLPVDHPLADTPYFPIEKLEGSPFIKCRERMDYEVSRFLDRTKWQPSTQYEVSNDHTILAMVESGLGISISHSLYMNSNRYRVVWKQFDERQYRDIGIATAKQVRLTRATQLFVDHVCSYIRGEEK